MLVSACACACVAQVLQILTRAHVLHMLLLWACCVGCGFLSSNLAGKSFADDLAVVFACHLDKCSKLGRRACSACFFSDLVPGDPSPFLEFTGGLGRTMQPPPR